MLRLLKGADNMENMQQSQAPVGESQFTGGLLGLIGINILQGLLIAFTLGFGAPWAICMKERWIAKHTFINGRQLAFDGTGGQLFGKYIIWLLLTLITCGIYAYYWAYKMGSQLDTYENKPASRGILYIILQFIGLGIVTYALIQDSINKINQ